MSDFLRIYDQQPAVYLALAAAGLLFFIFTALAPAFLSPITGYGRNRWCSREALFGLGIAASLFAGRWPYLCFRRFFNPDESQQIAGGITLAHDPRFWLSVDGATAGPMDFYYLALPEWLGGRSDYTTARLSALLLVLGTVWFGYRILRLHYSKVFARIGLIPLVFFFSWVNDADLVEISTEHMPVFLLSAALFFFLSPLFRPQGSRRDALSWLVAGIAAGLAPWAKLQAAVSVLALLGAAVFLAYRADRNSWSKRRKKIWPFVAGLALPSLGFGVLMVATHQVDTFYTSYLAANLDYTYRGTAKVYLLAQFWEDASETGFFPVFLFVALAWVTFAFVIARRQQRPLSGFFWTLLGAVGVGFCTVFSPGRPFLHYLLFVTPAIGLLLGSAWVETAQRAGLGEDDWRSSLTLIFSALLPLLIIRAMSPIPFSGRLQSEWNRPLSPAAAAIRPYLRSGDTIALWGWLPDLYVELDLAQGVRDAHTQREIENTPFRAYYQTRYLADFLHNRPVAFVDAVGMAGFVFRNRAQFGFEMDPDLQHVIASQYTQVADLITGRVFIRNDRFLGKPAGTEKVGLDLARF